MTRLACQTITWGETQLMNAYPTVLKQVQEIGYEGVETKFAVLERYQEQLSALKAKTGLQIIACHLGYPTVLNALSDKSAAEAVERVLEASEAKFILVSDEPHESVDAYRVMGEQLTRFSERVLDFNVRVLFHNHRREIEGDMARLHALVDHSAQDRVGLAVDFGWVLQAHGDPKRVVDAFHDRIGYVHLKDAKSDGTWTELGQGALPVETVIAAIRPLQLPWWTAEQDTTEQTAKASASKNFSFLDPLRA
ncbi:MAG: sugar phosphate isomerase/epimerase [Firmicutes bacterium]|jgi:sugar phosphate isomerase/epimerase|nr:sugar phosphate isomerase/epimerase [Bacillota bacterium]MCL5066247.1 sugar phosphate isomerase/epimerase [Bacillota bacterium]